MENLHEDAGNVVGKRHSRKLRKACDEIASLQSKQSTAKWLSALEKMCREE